MEPLRELRVEGLTYHYPGTPAGIADVDLVLPGGSFTVVTGRIGSGKTTLLRAILGLLPADAGTVRWNGEVVADPAESFVPPRAAYTPQVPRLFSLSLRDNLLLGRTDPEERVEEAIRAAVLEPDLAGMPAGLATMVGPLGVRLSGGQVQRAAAARMFLRRPELLVVDDLSSALDVETEKLLWERLIAERRRGHQPGGLPPASGPAPRRPDRPAGRGPGGRGGDPGGVAGDEPGLPQPVGAGAERGMSEMDKQRRQASFAPFGRSASTSRPPNGPVTSEGKPGFDCRMR